MAMTGDILVVTAMGVLLVSNVEKTEIMLNILQCTGQLSPTKNYPSQNFNCVAIEIPCSSPTVLSEGKIGLFKWLMIVQSVTSGSRVIFKPGLLIHQVKQVIDHALFPFFHCGCRQKVNLIGC